MIESFLPIPFTRVFILKFNLVFASWVNVSQIKYTYVTIFFLFPSRAYMRYTPVVCLTSSRK